MSRLTVTKGDSTVVTLSSAKALAAEAAATWMFEVTVMDSPTPAAVAGVHVPVIENVPGAAPRADSILELELLARSQRADRAAAGVARDGERRIGPVADDRGGQRLLGDEPHRDLGLLAGFEARRDDALTDSKSALGPVGARAHRRRRRCGSEARRSLIER
jgi:hypothetical protein